jgi:hypothetical protein
MPTPGHVLAASPLRARPPLPNRSLRELREGSARHTVAALAAHHRRKTGAKRTRGEVRGGMGPLAAPSREKKE